MKLNSIRGRKVSWTSKALDGNGTVADAVRDEKETLATPRSVNLFQEGPSVSVSLKFCTTLFIFCISTQSYHTGGDQDDTI